MPQDSIPSAIIVEGREALTKLQNTSEKPILVKFVSPYCPSCETLVPVLQQLIMEYANQIHLVSIDMTEEPELAMTWGIRSAPTVVLVKGDNVLEKIVGLKPKKVYLETVQKSL